jgi:hypothetical protein
VWSSYVGRVCPSISECQALITALRVKTSDPAQVQIAGKNAEKDRAGLVSKLTEASIKLDQAKFCDAIAKLNDFKSRVQELVAAGQLRFETGEGLSSDADRAIACVAGVANSAGVPCSM